MITSPFFQACNRLLILYLRRSDATITSDSNVREKVKGRLRNTKQELIKGEGYSGGRVEHSRL